MFEGRFGIALLASGRRHRNGRRATLATRNVRHFADLTVTVIDPWTAG